MTCSSHWPCQSSSVSWSGGLLKLVPALLTSTSRRPICSVAQATMRSGTSGPVTSAASQSAPISSAASRSASSLRATISTRAPSPASWPLSARPIPRLAPVTTHTRSRSPKSIARNMPGMASHTAYLTFDTDERHEFVRITDDVQRAVEESGVREGLVLVSAMHITAAVWVNDDEPGILADTLEWLDKLAPPSWKEPANDVAAALSPDPGDFRHHRGGEDNGDAHFKNLLVHHQVVLPITEGKLDLGPWQAVFYCEFDGRRRKRLVIKVLGE